jgi:ankyrin repeat protein
MLGLKPLPVRAGLAQYLQQASRLLLAWAARNPEAIRCIRQHHPRLPGRPNTNDRNPVTESDIRDAGVGRADAQTIVARWHGFESWPKLTRHIELLKEKKSLVLQFELAVEAIINGKIAALKSLLRQCPDVIGMRSTREHQATLLHYACANGVEGYRQKTPKNAVKVAGVLIKAGAEIDADLDYGTEGRKMYPERTGSTPLGMVATSVHPAAAGVQLELLEKLIKAGANLDGLPGGWNPVIAALHNGRGKAAEFLARRGARLDLEGAAGTGRLDAVKSFFTKDGQLTANATRNQMEAGFMWACEYGWTKVVAFLLEHQPELSNARLHGESGLHWSAFGGHKNIVKLLLKQNPAVNLIDVRFHSTPLGWALHGWCYPPPEARHNNYHEVVSLLVKAGATMEPARNLDRSQLKKLRSDSRMRRLLASALGLIATSLL